MSKKYYLYELILLKKYINLIFLEHYHIIIFVCRKLFEECKKKKY